MTATYGDGLEPMAGIAALSHARVRHLNTEHPKLALI